MHATRENASFFQQQISIGVIVLPDRHIRAQKVQIWTRKAARKTATLVRTMRNKTARARPETRAHSNIHHLLELWPSPSFFLHVELCLTYSYRQALHFNSRRKQWCTCMRSSHRRRNDTDRCCRLSDKQRQDGGVSMSMVNVMTLADI